MSGMKIRQSLTICVWGFFICVMVENINAFQFVVGGSNGWMVPNTSSTMYYKSWAERNRFSIGDSILFVYDPAYDSVLEVSKEHYEHCTKASPMGTYTDGHTVYSFNHSGAHYFISGYKDSCHKNEKVVIVVLADKRSNPKVVAASPPSFVPSTTDRSPSPQLTHQSTNKGTILSSMAMAGGSVGVAFLASFVVTIFR
ncbi:Early nodulin-like protein 1 [Linum perenne]